jgi:protein-tyrosine phosphatase
MDASNLPRSIMLEGASNVRDLGGYVVEGGGRVRFGLVYRSASLAGLTPRARQDLAALGLRTIVDLRGTKEAASWPTPDLDGVTCLALPIEPSVGASLRDLAATGRTTGEDAMGIMRRAYVAYVTDCAAQYRGLLARLLDDDGPPLLFHCSAGKDRTGFGAALLLRLLGVSMDDVRNDYLATNRLWHGDSALARELPPAMGAVLLRVHAPLLDAAFAAVDAAGGLDEYARDRLGLDRSARARLIERLVDAG